MDLLANVTGSVRKDSQIPALQDGGTEAGKKEFLKVLNSKKPSKAKKAENAYQDPIAVPSPQSPQQSENVMKQDVLEALKKIAASQGSNQDIYNLLFEYLQMSDTEVSAGNLATLSGKSLSPALEDFLLELAGASPEKSLFTLKDQAVETDPVGLPQRFSSSFLTQLFVEKTANREGPALKFAASENLLQLLEEITKENVQGGQVAGKKAVTGTEPGKLSTVEAPEGIAVTPAVSENDSEESGNVSLLLMQEAKKGAPQGSIPIREANTPASTEMLKVHILDLVKHLKERISENPVANQIKIKLDPPNLGEILVKITMADKKLDIQFNVNNPLVRNILDENKAELIEGCARKGIDIGNLDINNNNNNRDDRYEGEKRKRRESQEVSETILPVRYSNYAVNILV